MKTWKPGTCDCHLEEIYNGTEIVGMGQVLEKCAAHASVPDAALYGVIISNPDSEGKRHMGVYRTLLGMEDVNGLGLEEMKKDGQGFNAGLGLKDRLEYVWSFEGTGKERVLVFDVVERDEDRKVIGSKLTQAHKNSLHASHEKRFGVGKVKART